MAKAGQDLIGVLRGLQLVAEAARHEQSVLLKQLWSNSSIRELLEDNLRTGEDRVRTAVKNPTEELNRLAKLVQETSERTAVVLEGVKQLAGVTVARDFKMSQMPFGMDANKEAAAQTHYSAAADQREQKTQANINTNIPRTSGGKIDAANLDISSITLKEMEDILSRRLQNRRRKSLEKEEPKVATPTEPNKSDNVNKAASSGDVTEKPTNAPSESMRADTEYVKNILNIVAGAPAAPAAATTSALTSTIDVPTLSKVAKQRKVPSSRLGRMVSFGSLFAGLGVGTVNELTKGALGLGGSTSVKEALLSPANAERIVDTLCKVRGAALKIGQILSIQDSNVVSPQLAKAFERVRQAADYMPDWQVERVMSSQLGADWHALLQTFEDKPFAAASIGQVHKATLKDGMQVAVKIQYPGVAKSIESDIDNLVGMLKVWDVFPQGFFIDNLVKVAKRELIWEVDYTREADYTQKFKEMIAPYEEYYVPKVVRDLTTSSVLTTELVPGVPLDKCFDLSYDHRKHIGESILKLCLRELFELQCMQTDPNWSNFLYDAESRKLMLIDFGSTRFYKKEFIRNYRNVILCAVNDNRKGVLEISREMGFLTGYESKQMEEAHVDAVMILGEMFRQEGEFNFAEQNTTERIAHLVPTMVAQRLCPPPEEIYSIHRKLSGIFLLCSRLRITLRCRPLFEEIVVGKFRE